MFSKKIIIFLSSFILILFSLYLALSIYITTLAIKATRKLPEDNPASAGLVY